MQKKYDIVANSAAKGDWKTAFGTARSFFYGLTPDEKRTIEIAADVINGRGLFYTKIGIDTAKELELAQKVILSKYPVNKS